MILESIISCHTWMYTIHFIICSDVLRGHEQANRVVHGERSSTSRRQAVRKQQLMHYKRPLTRAAKWREETLPALGRIKVGGGELGRDSGTCPPKYLLVLCCASVLDWSYDLYVLGFCFLFLSYT